MPQKSAGRTRHIPRRTCVGCHEILAKRSLIRVVRLAQPSLASTAPALNADPAAPVQVKVDPTGKISGRGAYIHNQRSCWRKALKGSLAHALKISLTPQDIRELELYIQSIPEDETSQ